MCTYTAFLSLSIFNQKHMALVSLDHYFHLYGLEMKNLFPGLMHFFEKTFLVSHLLLGFPETSLIL